MTAVLSSCSKSQIETDSKPVAALIKLNISVSNPCAQTKALIKSDWARYDRIKIWYDGNTGDTPDLVIEYDGSNWNNTGATVSGKSPSEGENHYLKALFNNKVAVTAKDGYTYDGSTLEFHLKTWTFLTEIQVVIYPSPSHGSTEKYYLACNRFFPYAGYTVGAESITAKTGAKGSYANCIGYADGAAFVFATADYSADASPHVFSFRNDYEFQTVEHSVSKAIEKPSSGIKAIKLSYNNFKLHPDNALNGFFSVRNGETAPVKYVHFSKGNLRVFKNGSKYNWYFASKQEDKVGNAVGNTNFESSEPIDLLCWSTTGASNNWGLHDKTSATEGYTTGDFKEWGQCIDNNGTWRTLTADEWEYLLERVNDKGELLNQVTYINYTDVDDHDSGNFGLILYPDNYSGDVTGGDYTSDQWTSMQNAGCVFLPAAGIREGLNVSYTTNGYYWTSSEEESMPYFMVFDDSGAAVKNYSSAPSVSRCSGCAVRLVTDVK